MSNLEIQKNNAETVSFPFGSFLSPDDGYHYFDMERMTSELIFTEKNVKAARALIKAGKVSVGNINLSMLDSDNNEEETLYGETEVRVAGEAKDENVSLRFTKNSFLRLHCNACSTFKGFNRYAYANSTVCVHCTAALLALGEKLKKENPGDETDAAAKILVETFKANKKFDIEEAFGGGYAVSLEPRLQIEDNKFFVDFKIGQKKLYVVKDLFEFLDCAEQKSVLSLGKDCNIDFSTAFFDESSKKYFELLVQMLREEKFLNDILPRFNPLKDETEKGRLLLYGNYLDAFFDIALEQQNATNTTVKNSEEGEFSFAQKNPPIKIKLGGERTVAGFDKITAESKVPRTILGAKYRYFVKGEKICRIEPDFADKISLLEKMSGGKENFSFSVGRKQATEFMHNVLPWIKDFAQVDESPLQEIRESLPPKVQFKFFLDRVYNDVTCQVQLVYGNKIFSAVDLINENAASGYDFRDAEREQKAREVLDEFFWNFDRINKQYLTDDEDQIYDLLNSGISRLMQIGEVHTTESFLRLKIHKRVKVNVGVSIKSGLLDIKISSDEHTQETLLEILEGYKQKRRFVRLKDGDFVNTQTKTLEDLQRMIDTLQISPKEFVQGKMHIPSYRALYLEKMLEGNDSLYAERDENFKNLVSEFEKVESSSFELPSTLGVTMREYQVFGHKWLRTLQAYNFGGVLADDMGLGKTLQAISVLLSAKENKIKGTALVVCPASLVYNWGEELQKFAPLLKTVLIAGTQNERAKEIANIKNYDVAVTSYDLLKRDIAEYEPHVFLFQMLDEAQSIKNHSTATAKAVKTINAKHKFALTGTPIENRLSELWSIFDFIMPGFLYGAETFRKEFEIPIVKNQDEEAIGKLKKMVSPFILRRLKTDVLKDLPEKTEEICYAKFSREQQRLYDAEAVKIRRMVEDKDFDKSKIQVLAELTKIRQICCDPSLLFENYSGSSAKREACVDLILSAVEGGHKILLFSQFTSMLNLIEKDLRVQNIKCYKITGDLPKPRRMELVKKFNKDSTPVFLISLKAGGTGLNLTGADIVIHYDPWWNIAAQNQATDRAHRMGQTRVVSVFKLIAKGSIEEKIVEMQNTKKQLADEILSGETGSIASMSREELLSLL